MENQSIKSKIQEFEEMETLKKHFRAQILHEIKMEIDVLSYSKSNEPRSAETFQSENIGYKHGIKQVTQILDAFR